jgi:outer membrane lipoprotein-sorting protein
MIRKIIAPLFSLVMLLCAQASAQTVDELIRKNIEARGGLEKLKAVKSMRLTGKLITDGLQVSLTINLKRPGLARGEVSIQGMTIVKAYDGETAWEINQSEGKPQPEKILGDDAKTVKDWADFDGPLVDYKAKGLSVEFVSKEELEATPVYKLKVTEKSGDVRYIYLDAENYLELKMSTVRKDQGKQYVDDEYYSNYKPVGGLMIAHAIETRINGEPDDHIGIDKVELDVTIDDAIFKMPVKSQEKRP